MVCLTNLQWQAISRDAQQDYRDVVQRSLAPGRI
jgi:hypothetical protein